MAEKKSENKGTKIGISLVLLAIAGALIAWNLLGGGGNALGSLDEEVGARLAETLAGELSSGDSVVIIVRSTPSEEAAAAERVLTEKGLQVSRVYAVQESGPQQSENMSPREWARELERTYAREAQGQAAALIFGDFPPELDPAELEVPVAAVGAPTATRARQLRDGDLVALLIDKPNSGAIDLSSDPSPAELFEQLYLIVTADNLDSLR